MAVGETSLHDAATRNVEATHSAGGIAVLFERVLAELAAELRGRRAGGIIQREAEIIGTRDRNGVIGNLATHRRRQRTVRIERQRAAGRGSGFDTIDK